MAEWRRTADVCNKEDCDRTPKVANGFKLARRFVTAPPMHQERTFEILAPQGYATRARFAGPITSVPTSQKTRAKPAARALT